MRRGGNKRRQVAPSGQLTSLNIVPMSNLPIARRLSLVLAGVIGVFLLVVGVAAFSALRLQALEKINIHTYQVLRAGDAMMEDMVNMQTGQRGFLLGGEDRYLAPWHDGLRHFDTHWADAKRLTADNPAQQQRLDDMRQRQQDFVKEAAAQIQIRRDMAGGGKTSADLASAFASGRGKVAMDAQRTLKDAFEATETNLLTARMADADAMRDINLGIMVGGSLAALALALALGTWITRSITHPIQQAVRVARAVAGGDLSARIDVRGQDEVGQLLGALRDMQDGLANVVANVRQGAQSVSFASGEIAQGTHDLSSRTEQQASTLEETAAAMQQLSATVKQNADSARKGNELAICASTVAFKRGDAVGQVVTTM